MSRKTKMLSSRPIEATLQEQILEVIRRMLRSGELDISLDQNYGIKRQGTPL